MVRLVKMEEIPAITAEYRKRHGIPEINRDAPPAERMKAMQEALDNMTRRLERMRRLIHLLRDDE